MCTKRKLQCTKRSLIGNSWKSLEVANGSLRSIFCVGPLCIIVVGSIVSLSRGVSASQPAVTLACINYHLVRFPFQSLEIFICHILWEVHLLFLFLRSSWGQPVVSSPWFIIRAAVFADFLLTHPSPDISCQWLLGAEKRRERWNEVLSFQMTWCESHIFLGSRFPTEPQETALSVPPDLNMPHIRVPATPSLLTHSISWPEDDALIKDSHPKYELCPLESPWKP